MLLLRYGETFFLVPQDRYAVEMAGPDYAVTKEFIVKLMPVSERRSRSGALLLLDIPLCLSGVINLIIVLILVHI